MSDAALHPYDNRGRVPGFAQVVDGWRSCSQALLGEFDHQVLTYGEHAREKVHLVSIPAAQARSPLVVFVHGGYWQGGEALDHVCHIERFVRATGSGALISYPQLPDVGLADIVRSATDAVAASLEPWHHRKMMIIGHSAGAHLAAWAAEQVPDSFFVGISGVYDLAPLLNAEFLAHLPVVGMHDAVRSSALRASAPRHSLLAVGALEHSCFRQQSVDLSIAWHGASASSPLIVEGADHFTVLDELRDPVSALAREVDARLAEFSSIN